MKLTVAAMVLRSATSWDVSPRTSGGDGAGGATLRGRELSGSSDSYSYSDSDCELEEGEVCDTGLLENMVSFHAQCCGGHCRSNGTHPVCVSAKRDDFARCEDSCSSDNDCAGVYVGNTFAFSFTSAGYFPIDVSGLPFLRVFGSYVGACEELDNGYAIASKKYHEKCSNTLGIDGDQTGCGADYIDAYTLAGLVPTRYFTYTNSSSDDFVYQCLKGACPNGAVAGIKYFTGEGYAFYECLPRQFQFNADNCEPIDDLEICAIL